MTTSTVTELERQLKATEAETEKLKRKMKEAKQLEIERTLEKLSREGAAVKAEFDPMAAGLNNDQNLQLRLHAELVRAKEQINVHSQPLDPLSFPSRTAERNRLRNLAEWKDRQRQLLLQHHDCVRRQSVRPRAIQLARRLDQIRFEIQNWTAILEGRRPGQIEGGTFQGVEDFLGNSQVGPARNL
jgi:hypothetical protein